MISLESKQIDSGDAALVFAECRVCHTPYDPTCGDPSWPVDPGTPFDALPEAWECTACRAPKSSFFERRLGPSDLALARAQLGRLKEVFETLWTEGRCRASAANPDLRVEIVNRRRYGARQIAVLITPASMDILLLSPSEDDLPGVAADGTGFVAFPTGEFAFLRTGHPDIGSYMACRLFSDMRAFKTQDQARDVAETVVAALFGGGDLDPVKTSEKGPVRADA